MFAAYEDRLLADHLDRMDRAERAYESASDRLDQIIRDGTAQTLWAHFDCAARTWEALACECITEDEADHQELFPASWLDARMQARDPERYARAHDEMVTVVLDLMRAEADAY